ERVKHRLDELAVHMSQEDKMPDDAWPLYGSLIMSMRHIAVVVDDVASTREARTSGREHPQACAAGNARPREPAWSEARSTQPRRWPPLRRAHRAPRCARAGDRCCRT